MKRTTNGWGGGGGGERGGRQGGERERENDDDGDDENSDTLLHKDKDLSTSSVVVFHFFVLSLS